MTTLYARSDLVRVAVPADAGGCGQPHSRPVINGAPVRVWQLECPNCTTVLKADLLWSANPAKIPLTPDEEQVLEQMKEEGARTRASQEAIEAHLASERARAEIDAQNATQRHEAERSLMELRLAQMSAEMERLRSMLEASQANGRPPAESRTPTETAADFAASMTYEEAQYFDRHGRHEVQEPASGRLTVPQHVHNKTGAYIRTDEVLPERDEKPEPESLRHALASGKYSPSPRPAVPEHERIAVPEHLTSKASAYLTASPVSAGDAQQTPRLLAKAAEAHRAAPAAPVTKAAVPAVKPASQALSERVLPSGNRNRSRDRCPSCGGPMRKAGSRGPTPRGVCLDCRKVMDSAGAGAAGG